MSICLGTPIGLLTTAILWINEFPDMESDAASGKNNLVVVTGKASARYGYVFLISMAMLWLVCMVGAGWMHAGALMGFLSLPLAFYAIRIVFNHWQDRSLIRANSSTIQLHLATGMLVAVGLIWFG